MNGWAIKRRGIREGGEGNTKCQHKHKLISDAINVNKRSRLISQYICLCACLCACLSSSICIVSFMCEWQREAADTSTQHALKWGEVEGGLASKAIKINNFQYFALMEKQRKTRASRVFSNEASDVTRPRNLNFSCNRPPLPSSFLCSLSLLWPVSVNIEAIRQKKMP